MTFIVYAIFNISKKTENGDYQFSAYIYTFFAKSFLWLWGILNFLQFNWPCTFYSLWDFNNILSKFQFGFRKNMFAENSIYKVINNIIKSLILAIFLCVTKTFDIITNYVLLDKMEDIGIRGQALELFKSYLPNRKQEEKCADWYIWCSARYNTRTNPLSHLLNSLLLLHTYMYFSLTSPAYIVWSYHALKNNSKLVRQELSFPTYLLPKLTSCFLSSLFQ